MSNEAIINIRVEPVGEGVYLATSRDVPGLVVEANSIFEAVSIAQDLANTLAESGLHHGDRIPEALLSPACHDKPLDFVVPVRIPFRSEVLATANNEQCSPIFDKTYCFAARLLTMIQSRLIDSRVYCVWARWVVANHKDAQQWVHDLTLHTLPALAIGTIESFLRESHGMAVEQDVRANEYIACLFLRHERNEISWATFLNDAGAHSDCSNAGNWTCEDFYSMLNEYESSEFSESLASTQRGNVLASFSSSITDFGAIYESLNTFAKSTEA